MTFDKARSTVDLEGQRLYLDDLEMALSLLRINGYVTIENCNGVFSLAMLIILEAKANA